jgi:hypothetical protein
MTAVRRAVLGLDDCEHVDVMAVSRAQSRPKIKRCSRWSDDLLLALVVFLQPWFADS